MVSFRQMVGYVGFTETKVMELYKEHGMLFAEMQCWYDGYFLKQ